MRSLSKCLNPWIDGKNPVRHQYTYSFGQRERYSQKYEVIVLVKKNKQKIKFRKSTLALYQVIFFIFTMKINGPFKKLEI